MIVHWRIWYDDGSTFDSSQGPPESAPLDGVMAVAEEHDDGRKQTYWGSDYYYWTGDSWAAGNQADLERWMRRELPALKYGRWARNDAYFALRERVKQEWLARS